MTRILPDFLVIGGVKCGTTSLHRYLSDHPQIFVPEIKEVRFFNNDQAFARGVADYAVHFDCPERLAARTAGELTPAYLTTPGVARRVHDVLGDIRLIAVLREPVARAYSEYWQRMRRGVESRDFATLVAEHLAGREEVSCIARSEYARHLDGWLDAFPRAHLKVVGSPALEHATDATMRDIFAFLGVDRIDAGVDTSVRLHRASRERLRGLNQAIRFVAGVLRPVTALLGRHLTRRFKQELLRWNRRPLAVPPIDERVAARLREYFMPHNERLVGQLGALPWLEGGA